MTAVRKPIAEIVYPESDGMPMAESDLHRDIMVDLINRLKERYAKRKNVYVTGNLLVYYEEGQWGVSLAPDCMVVFGVPAGDRRIFKTWEEGAFPSVVFEITSKTTQREDMLKKLRIYERIWKVKEVFLFDPTRDYLEPSLVGYRLSHSEYVQLKPSAGRLVSRELESRWSGTARGWLSETRGLARSCSFPLKPKPPASAPRSRSSRRGPRTNRTA
jgi:Uma2 family endonuclease